MARWGWRVAAVALLLALVGRVEGERDISELTGGLITSQDYELLPYALALEIPKISSINHVALEEENERVINGQIVEDSADMPFLVGVYSYDRLGTFPRRFLCSGVIVDTNVVMTSAFCAQRFFFEPLQVCWTTDGRAQHTGLMRKTRFKCSFIEQKRSNIKWRTALRRQVFKLNIALIKTRDPLVDNGSDRKIMKVDFEPARAGIDGLFFGFGSKDGADIRTGRFEPFTFGLKLRRIMIEIVPGSHCFAEDDRIHEYSHLCINTNNNQGICYGDHAGPIVDNRGSTNPMDWRLIGISSFYFTSDGVCSRTSVSGAASLSNPRAKAWFRKTIAQLGGQFHE